MCDAICGDTSHKSEPCHFHAALCIMYISVQRTPLRSNTLKEFRHSNSKSHQNALDKHILCVTAIAT